MPKRRKNEKIILFAIGSLFAINAFAQNKHNERDITQKQNTSIDSLYNINMQDKNIIKKLQADLARVLKKNLALQEKNNKLAKEKIRLERKADFGYEYTANLEVAQNLDLCKRIGEAEKDDTYYNDYEMAMVVPNFDEMALHDADFIITFTHSYINKLGRSFRREVYFEWIFNGNKENLWFKSEEIVIP